MEALDRVLGFAEFGLVAFSLGWLVVAAARPHRRRIRRASALALVLAATVAQPFGVVVHKAGRLPPEAVPAEASGMHVARLFGAIPIAPFVLYRREDLLAGIRENTPTHTARARSWFWLPVLTNGAKVASICGDNVFTPCWEPDASEARYWSLRLATAGGDHWVTFTNPYARGDLADELPATFEAWRLRPGIASPAGLLFWLLAGGLGLAARRRA